LPPARQQLAETTFAAGRKAALVFGALVALYPAGGAVAIVWLIGAYAILFGLALVALSLRLRTLNVRLRTI
jgi:uncharacterized membrane protein HdeD (DUF308 family)